MKYLQPLLFVLLTTITTTATTIITTFLVNQRLVSACSVLFALQAKYVYHYLILGPAGHDDVYSRNLSPTAGVL